MPIQFSCPHCDHRLRTPDEKAGMSAKCPACGERIVIPHAHEVEEADALLDHGDSPQGPATASGEDPAAREERACPECGGDNGLDVKECEFCGASLRRRGAGSGRESRTLAPRGEVLPADLEIGRIMADAWTIYTRDMVPLLFGPLLLGLAVAVGWIPLIFCAGLTGPFAILIAFPLGWLVQAIVEIGTNFLYFKGARDDAPEIADAFSAFGRAAGYLGPMFLYAMLYGLLTFVGFLLLIIPGLYLYGIGWLIPRVLLDEGLDGTAAIRRGWELAHSNLGTTLLIALLCVGIGLVSGLVPIVGPIFVGPYLSLICTVAYLRMTGQPVAVESRGR